MKALSPQSEINFDLGGMADIDLTASRCTTTEKPPSEASGPWLKARALRGEAGGERDRGCDR